MIQKKHLMGILMLLASAFYLCGCSSPGIVQAKNNTPTPAISHAATPTPTEDMSGDRATATPVPTATNTPTPTATPTPTPSPTPVPSVPVAPVTVNTDITTDTFLVNRDYPLSASYAPTDLVIPDIKFSFMDQTADKRKLRKVAAEALEELCNTALAEAELTIYGVSGYRSYDRQYDIYGGNIIKKGIRHTNLYSAAPGTSEHQTGLAIDVSCASIGYALENRFAETPEGIWLTENCWRFGFILRYPKEKESITGYAYEPWHIRYVGVPLAYYLYTNNLTLEEYYGTPSSQTLAELKDKPLIDLHTKRFYLLYAATLGSEVYYDANGNILVSQKTGYPHLKEKIRDTEGNAIKVNGNVLFLEPVYDRNGNMMFNSDGTILYAKPYFDAEGNLWLDYNNSPVFLQPLWHANGTLAYDAAGNLLFTEPLYNEHGLEYITTTGAPLLKIPVRDAEGELTYAADGSVLFYEPFTIPATNEIIMDTSTGLPLFPSAYYEVPHNTYPYPEGFSLPAEEDFFPEEEDFIPEEPEYEDNLFWNDSEWSEETTTEDTVVSDDNYTGGSL